MKITLLDGVLCTPDRGNVAELPAGQFLDWLGDRAKCPSVECATVEDKLAGAGFVFAQYRAGATSKGNAELSPESATDLLCYDVDHVELDALRAVLPRWAKIDGVSYSTMKHTTDAPRLRVIVRLDRPVGNYDDAEFRLVYGGVAYLLGIPADPQASDRARFYFGPQHRPGSNGSIERIRFTGEPIPVDDVLAAIAAGSIPTPKAVGAGAAAAAFEGVLAKPDRRSVKALATRLASSRVERAQRIGVSLSAALRGESFAPAGEIHTAMVQIAFEVVRAVPRLDAVWFADTYFAASWSVMWPGEEPAAALEDWGKAVSSAEDKLEAGRVESATAAARYTPLAATDMDADTLAKAAAVAGGLVCEHRGSYYVWDPKAGVYAGPIKGTGLAAACRRSLVGVPGFMYQTPRSNGAPTLKSGPKLVEEYGVDLESVHYYAAAPAPSVAFDVSKRLIRVPAYQWNTWDPVFCPFVDALFRAMAGESYPRLEAWLYKLCDLSQPLPALTLIGSRGTWKSRLCQTLSRFWGSADAPSPCDASQVLNRFSAPLLFNPVIWSDESLAKGDSGKAIPEAYRRSITELTHFVERKGVDPVTLHTATRHVISVNDPDKVFGGEIDAASVEATIERYLVLMVDAAAVAALETAWAGTPELHAARLGASILRHVAWIQANATHTSAGRLFVATDTNAELLLQARFADDTLTVCANIAIEALLAEGGTSVPGQLGRLPLVCDDSGRLRLSPGRIVERWPESRLAAGSGLKKPTAQRVGRMFQKAGFKLDPGERAIDSRKWKAWAVAHGRLREFLHVEGSHDWDEIRGACERVFGRAPLDDSGLALDAKGHINVV